MIVGFVMDEGVHALGMFCVEAATQSLFRVSGGFVGRDDHTMHFRMLNRGWPKSCIPPRNFIEMLRGELEGHNMFSDRGPRSGKVSVVEVPVLGWSCGTLPKLCSH